MDRLNAMAAFVAVCDCQGFAPAARRLALSPSVVTRLVSGMEEHLGVRLLQRTTRSLKLTDAGARFLDRARRILGEVEEAELSAHEEHAHPRGRLVVAAPVLFGRMHVAPLLSAYLRRFADMRAELQLSDRLSSLVEEGVDVAVRVGKLADSGLVARRLGETRRVLVASPTYLERSGGAPHHPRDIARHQLIAFMPMAGAPHWRFVDQGDPGRELRVAVEPRYVTNSGDAAIAHALVGGGMTLAFYYQVVEAIHAGRLIELLKPYAPPAVPIQAVYPTSRLVPSKVRHFLELADDLGPWRFG